MGTPRRAVRYSGPPPGCPTGRREERSEHHQRTAPSPAGRGAAPDRRRARCAGANRAHQRPPLEPRRVRADGQGGSDRPARVAGGAACAGARADPIRPDAGVAVHVLPGSCAADGRRPRVDAELGLACAALRRRPSLELRRLRIARTPPGVRPERLRRDAGGALGVGRKAAGGELCGGRSRERLLRQDRERRSSSAPSRRTARQCASSPE